MDCCTKNRTDANWGRVSQHTWVNSGERQCAPEEIVLRSLGKLDARYGALQSASVGLEVAKALCAAAPFDLNEAELPNYKGLTEKWHRWENTRAICQRFGIRLGGMLVQEGN